MPSKPWRWTERLRATDGPPRPVQPMRLAEGEDPTPARLTELAAEHATGALYVNGRWGGTVFLVNGRIGHVESVLTPGVEALLLRPTYPSQRGWAEAIPTLRNGETGAAAAAAAALLRDRSLSTVEAEILRQTAMADAALATLGTVVPDAARTRVRFRPGEKHWYESDRTFALADVLDEVRRRKAVLARLTLGVQPRRPVRRVSKLPIEQIRLSATQWNIARAADGSNSPLDIAWLLGHSGFATTVMVHQLALLGIVTTAPDRPEPTPTDSAPARHTVSFLRAAEPARNRPLH